MINPVPRLAKFVQALSRLDPPTVERVKKAYEKSHHGYKLAFIPRDRRTELIQAFPVQTQAEDRVISFAGLESYLKNLYPDKFSNLNNPSGLTPINQINVLSSMVTNHPLAKFITKQKPLFLEDYLSILKSGFVDLSILRKGKDNRTSLGVLEASQGNSHGDYVWTRDMAAVALGKLDIGQVEYAKKIAEKLYLAYCEPAQKNRISQVGTDPNTEAHNYPHTKFKVKPVTNGDQIIDYKLVDYDDKWGMKQLDAYGYFLTLTAKLAQYHGFDTDKIDNNETLINLSKMLIAIKYWDTGDFGAWEYPEHHQRASSIAACISGLKGVKNYLSSINHNDDVLFRELDEGIIEGEKVLFSKRIPSDEEASSGGKQALELNQSGSEFDNQTLQHQERYKDAALLFILCLSDPSLIGTSGVSELQKNSILKTVYDLMGDVGFKRFPTDEYMGMNWTLSSEKHPGTNYPEHANNQVSNYKPAEWCLFDPYLAGYFYKKYLDSKGADIESYLRADRHARRSLAQITKTNYKINKQEYSHADHPGKRIENGFVEIPAGEAMEHYWYSTKSAETNEPLKHGSWMPGENYRLNWTKIALQQMFYWGSKAGVMFKEQNPNGWHEDDITGLNLAMLGQKSKIYNPRNGASLAA